jgi:hypothetical protein
MPTLNATQWAQVSLLASWLETRKMASALTGPLLGAPLLADLSSRLAIAAACANATASPYARLVLTSAHYNTQLGLLSALNMDSLPAARAAAVPWLTRIPALASVLAFELHRVSGGGSNASAAHAVRAVVQDGPAANYTALPLPCESDAGAALAGEVRMLRACHLQDCSILVV